MKQGLLFLADGFETTEALATLDVLLRSKQIEVTTISLNEDLTATSNLGVEVICNAHIDTILPRMFDFAILPGGKLGVDNLKGDKRVQALLDELISLSKPIYAICAAPSILAEKGYYAGGDYTCFPGFEGGEGHYTGQEVVARKGKITARSMAYSIPFGEAIVKEQIGAKFVRFIRKGTCGLK